MHLQIKKRENKTHDKNKYRKTFTFYSQTTYKQRSRVIIHGESVFAIIHAKVQKNERSVLELVE